MCQREETGSCVGCRCKRVKYAVAKFDLPAAAVEPHDALPDPSNSPNVIDVIQAAAARPVIAPMGRCEVSIAAPLLAATRA